MSPTRHHGPRPLTPEQAERWRDRAYAALEAVVELAPAELRAAVRLEAAWEALRWFELATAHRRPGSTTLPLGTSGPTVEDAEAVGRGGAAMLRICGGHCGLPLPSRFYPAVPTVDGPRDFCPACHVDRFAQRKDPQ